jgi:hypothetical protein
MAQNDPKNLPWFPEQLQLCRRTAVMLTSSNETPDINDYVVYHSGNRTKPVGPRREAEWQGNRHHLRSLVSL